MNVLAIGAHPDDVEYGCGGMLTKYAQKGHDVYLWIASDGALGGEGAVRRQEQADSALIIGAREVFWGDYQDTEVPLTRELIARVESVIRQIKPRMIFVHYPDDTHQDHRNLAQGTMSATRLRPPRAWPPPEEPTSAPVHIRRRSTSRPTEAAVRTTWRDRGDQRGACLARTPMR